MKFLFLPFLAALAVNFVPTNLGAQVPLEKFVFVQPVGSAPPPVTSSSIFKSPGGVSIGASSSPGSVSGTIFVADPNNNQVVVFPPGASTPTLLSTLTCTISICAGTSPPSPWTLSGPKYVAAAPNGNIWISDTGNDVVVEVDPATSTVVAFAGAGPSNVVFGCTFGSCVPPHPNAGQNAGQFFGPGPLAVDSTGNVYVADAAGDLFLGVASSGARNLGCDFTGAANCPQAANFRIEKFDSNGTFLTSWGSFCSFGSTTGVLIDSNGDIIAGTAGGGTCDTSAPGASASGDGELAYVTGIAVNSVANVYVADAANDRIQKFTPSGTFRLKFGGLPAGNGDGQLNGPGGVAVDALDDSIYVVDVLNNRIQQFDGSGTFLSKGGSKGAFEAQFDQPIDIATVPGSIGLLCLLGYPDDCAHAFVVSEQSHQNRVQFVAARFDKDNDSITDEVDVDPNNFSNDFSNASLGFTTTGSIVDRGDQTFVVYNTLSPNPADEVRVRTETFGGINPLQLRLCGTVTLSFPAGTGTNLHCSTPTVMTEEGPVGFRFVGSDGTAATATLNTGDSLSVDPRTSTIISNSGTIALVVGGRTVSLSPGQSGFADTTPPKTTAVTAPTPKISRWNNTNVVVTFNATDNPGGSSVNAIAYSLSGAQTGNAVVPGSATTVTISAEGVTTVTYFGVDNAGNQETQKTLTVRIDKTPPTLICSASPSLLPRNQRLVPVTVAVSLTDSLSGPNGFVLSSVTSNERQPDNDIANDIGGFIVGTPSTSGFLRAERSFRDRVYTLVYTGSDVAGNHASCTVVVRVARHYEEDHDRDHDPDHDGE